MTLLALAAVLAIAMVGLVRPSAPLAAGANALAEESGQSVLVERFAVRTMRFRRNGALIGGLFAIVAVIVTVNEREDGAEMNLVLIASIALAGSVAGSIVAEAFRFQRRKGPQVASLNVRDVGAYTDVVADRRERFVIAGSVVALVTSAVGGGAISGPTALLGGVAAMAALRAWATRRIVLRSRPALPADLATADDHVRRLAISVGLGRPMGTLTALTTSVQFGMVCASLDDSQLLGQILAAACWLMSCALFLVASIWWWQNRNLGLDVQKLSDTTRRTRWAIATAILLLPVFTLVGRT